MPGTIVVTLPGSDEEGACKVVADTGDDNGPGACLLIALTRNEYSEFGFRPLIVVKVFEASDVTVSVG